MRKHFSYIQMVISGGEILSASSGLPTKCGEVHEQLFGLRHCPGVDQVKQVGFGLRLFTVVQITNLNVFLVAIILLAQLSKPFLQRKVEGLRFGYDRLNQF